MGPSDSTKKAWELLGLEQNKIQAKQTIKELKKTMHPDIKKQLDAEKKKKTHHLMGKFFGLLKVYGVQVPVKEYAFHPSRGWLFDMAWVDHKIALEVEGGVWTEGGHTRGKGFTKDILKYNQAGLLGWTVLRCTPDTLCTGETLDMLKLILINKQKP